MERLGEKGREACSQSPTLGIMSEGARAGGQSPTCWGLALHRGGSSLGEGSPDTLPSEPGLTQTPQAFCGVRLGSAVSAASELRARHSQWDIIPRRTDEKARSSYRKHCLNSLGLVQAVGVILVLSQQRPELCPKDHGLRCLLGPHRPQRGTSSVGGVGSPGRWGVMDALPNGPGMKPV